MTRFGSSLVTALVAGACMSSCGVGTQERPVPLDVEAPGRSGLESPSPGRRAVTVYLVRDGRLTPVNRSSADASLASALAFLSQGPNDDEVRSGLDTALTPQPLTPGPVDGSGTVTITATRAYTTVSGDRQLLATAQLVWTATEHDAVTRLRISVEGEPVAIPTDQGLSDRPVTRQDYRSVAPRG